MAQMLFHVQISPAAKSLFAPYGSVGTPRPQHSPLTASRPPSKCSLGRFQEYQRGAITGHCKVAPVLVEVLQPGQWIIWTALESMETAVRSHTSPSQYIWSRNVATSTYPVFCFLPFLPFDIDRQQERDHSAIRPQENWNSQLPAGPCSGYDRSSSREGYPQGSGNGNQISRQGFRISRARILRGCELCDDCKSAADCPVGTQFAEGIGGDLSGYTRCVPARR